MHDEVGYDSDKSNAIIVKAALDWRQARLDFLSLPPGAAEAKAKLAVLAGAEAWLNKVAGAKPYELAPLYDEPRYARVR
jgi:hypothetical protein